MILSYGASKILWRATVNSITPKPAPKCPPVFETEFIVSCLNSSATFFKSASDNFFKSSGESILSNRGVFLMFIKFLL